MSSVRHQDLIDCPATGRAIDRSLCWEYAFARAGGPSDTANALMKWLQDSGRFASLDDFHAVCSTCPHCPWSDTRREA